MSQSSSENENEKLIANSPEKCEHHYISIHQPDLPVYWIKQCGLCGIFDAEALREEIAKIVTADGLHAMIREVVELHERKPQRDYAVSFSQAMAMLHDAVSGAHTAFCRWGFADKTGPNFVRDGVLPAKPEGVGSKFADILIRLLYFSSQYEIDLVAEYRRKMSYNETEEYRWAAEFLLPRSSQSAG